MYWVYKLYDSMHNHYYVIIIIIINNNCRIENQSDLYNPKLIMNAGNCLKIKLENGPITKPYTLPNHSNFQKCEFSFAHQILKFNIAMFSRLGDICGLGHSEPFNYY